MTFTPPFKRNCFLVTDANDKKVVHTGLLGMRHGIDDEATAQLIVDALNNRPAADADQLTDQLEDAIRQRVKSDPEWVMSLLVAAKSERLIAMANKSWTFATAMPTGTN